MNIVDLSPLDLAQYYCSYETTNTEIVAMKMGKTKGPRFENGQRVKVVVLEDDFEPFDDLPIRYLRHNAKIGYILNSEPARTTSREGSQTQLWDCQVLMTRTGVTLQLPEEYLEPANNRCFVL